MPDPAPQAVGEAPWGRSDGLVPDEHTVLLGNSEVHTVLKPASQ